MCIRDRLNSTQDVLNKKKIKNLKDRQSIYNDLNLLQFIMEGNSEIKTFDFEGNKYKAKKAKAIYTQIENEANELTQDIRNTSITILRHFYTLAKKSDRGAEYKKKYNLLISEFSNYDKDSEIYNSIQEELNPIYQDRLPIKIAEKINENVKQLELKFKELIKQKISMNQLNENDFAQYLAKQRNYFVVDSFNDKNLEILISALNTFIEKQNLRLTKLKKEFLEYQLEL